MFAPLAFTKTFAMAAAAILSVTLVPALMVIFVRGKIIPETRNPLNRFLIWVYRPVIRGVLKAEDADDRAGAGHPWVSAWPASKLGSEFMPNLNEGTLFYMPTTLPGISVTKAADLLQIQNRIIKSFPEVESVFGKAGRASTATDPAPTEMYETVINLKPKSTWPAGMTIDIADRGHGQGAAISRRLQRLDDADQGAHRHALDRHSHAGRHQGVRHRSAEMERIAREIEQVLKTVPGTSSAYAERVIGGYYLDITPKRDILARYGLMVKTCRT